VSHPGEGKREAGEKGGEGGPLSLFNLYINTYK